MVGIGSLVSLIIILLVLGILLWVVFYVLSQFPTIEPGLGRLIRIVAVVIICLVLISVLLSFAGYPIFDFGRPVLRP